MFAIAWLPYRFSCRVALYSLPFSIALLLVTVIGGEFVASSYDIGRWIRAFGVVLQPVELAKVGLALALPYWIDLHPEVTTDLRSFLKMLAVPGIVILLLALQPNFGSALALSLLCLSIFWIAGVRARWIFLMLLAGALLCYLAYLHVGKIHERVDAWLQILFQSSQSNQYGYQSYQALVGLGSGGLRGVGPGMSTMKYLFLPASHTDFIFAILGEELGFIGTGGLLAALFFWFARTLKLARNAPDGLAYLVTLSIGAMILCYAILNLAVVVGLMPVTGLPLPFVSYGGSALITNLAGVGVLLSVSRTLGRQHNPNARWRNGR
jgi:cell division protein FtsW